MKKWVWSLSLALLVWAVGLKFSPEETIAGSFTQLRFEAASLLFGGFVGLMFGLVATKGRTVAEEKRKFLYSTVGCCLIGLALTWGPNIKRVVVGALVGTGIGLVMAGANYIVSGPTRNN